MHAPLPPAVIDFVPDQDLDQLLTELERPALQLLGQFSARVLVRTQRRKYQLRAQTADHWPHTLPGDAPPAAARAAELLRHVHDLRALCQPGASALVWHALQIGLLAQPSATFDLSKAG